MVSGSTTRLSWYRGSATSERLLRLFKLLAKLVAAGFKVIRDPILGQVKYRDKVFDTNYLNWLVGNGFVTTVGFGDDNTDAAARKRIEGYFPGRDVHIIKMLASWYDGGGVHCHTNDQLAL